MQKELKSRQEFYDWYKDNDFINFTEYDTFPYIDFEEEWNQKYENGEMEYVDEDYVSEAFENSKEEVFKKGELTYPEFFDIFTSHLMWDGYDEGKSMESEDAEIVAKDWEEYSKSLKYPLSVIDMLNIVDMAKTYKVEWKEDSITIKNGKDSVTFKKDIFSESKEKKMRKENLKKSVKESLKMRLRKRLEESKAIKEERGNPKYITVRVLQGNYGYGWDDLVEYDMTDEGRKECKADLKAYRENEKGIPFRIIHRRIPNDKYIPKETTDEIAKDEVESVNYRYAKDIAASCFTDI